MAVKPEISVVIPALNEQKYIMIPINGLRKQTFRKFETIVVDGGSNDGTVGIARKHSRIIIDTKKGPGAARNRGARAAKGSILLFIDADTEPTAGLLAEYARIFADKDVVAATGPILPLEKSGRRVRYGYMFVSILFVKASILLNRPAVVGSNFAVRRSAFMKVGGFDEKLITYEDWELSNRLKRFGRVVYSGKAVVHTSARRVMAWGVWGYFIYHISNIFRFHVFRKSKSNYRQIR